MIGSAVVYSSARSDWRTPPALWQALDAEFHFTLDVCATASSAIVKRYLGPDHHDELLRNALTCDWGTGEVCFMNPPYSREEGIDVAWFVDKAWRESVSNTVVALLPTRTDTRWWHACVMWADEVRLIPHRVKFLRPDGAEMDSGAGFPSAVVIWRPLHGVERRAVRFVTWDYL